jgi:hypothetical protein
MNLSSTLPETIESTWHADGSGSRQTDFVSDSGAVYVLRDWWVGTCQPV